MNAKKASGSDPATREDWASQVDVAMDDLDTVRVLAMLATKAEGLSTDDARSAFRKILHSLDVIHNDLDVLQETLRDAA